MAFNPDAYLAKKGWSGEKAVDATPTKGGFDPDAYLSKKGWSKNLPDPNDPTQSKVTAAAAGLAQGGTLGFAEEAGAAGSTAMNVLTGFTPPSEAMAEYQNRRNDLRVEMAKIKAANPKTFMAGEVVGGVASGGLAGAPKSLAGAAAQGAGMGAVGGLGGSNADLTKGEYVQAAKDAGWGGVGGTVGGVAGYGIGKGISALADGTAAKKLRAAAEYLSARAQGAERGTVKSLGADKVREVGRYGLDEGIVTPLASTEQMIARNDAIKSRGGKMMGEVYDAIDNSKASGVSPLDAAVKIEEKIGDFWRSPINKGETSQLENTLESVLMRGDKNMSLHEAQALKEELGKVANWKNKVSITDKERMARDAYGVVSDEIDKATKAGAEKIGSSELSGKLAEGKKLYSGSKGAETLLQNKEAREIGNKMLSLSNSAVGAGALASAVPTHGLSLLTVPAKILAEKYGNQTLAVGADKISNLLAKSPEAFGKFAPILQEAAQRGGKALSATNALLIQKDPQYAQLLNSFASSSGVTTPPVVAPGQEQREPATQPRGEALWIQKGADKLGLSVDDMAGMSKSQRELLIQAGDLPAGSKRLQMIKNKLTGGK